MKYGLNVSREYNDQNVYCDLCNVKNDYHVYLKFGGRNVSYVYNAFYEQHKPVLLTTYLI